MTTKWANSKTGTRISNDPLANNPKSAHGVLNNPTIHPDSAGETKKNQLHICRAPKTKTPFVDPKRDLIERKRFQKLNPMLKRTGRQRK